LFSRATAVFVAMRKLEVGAGGVTRFAVITLVVFGTTRFPSTPLKLLAYLGSSLVPKIFIYERTERRVFVTRQGGQEVVTRSIKFKLP